VVIVIPTLISLAVTVYFFFEAYRWRNKYHEKCRELAEANALVFSYSREAEFRRSENHKACDGLVRISDALDDWPHHRRQDATDEN